MEKRKVFQPQNTGVVGVVAAKPDGGNRRQRKSRMSKHEREKRTLVRCMLALAQFVTAQGRGSAVITCEDKEHQAAEEQTTRTEKQAAGAEEQVNGTET